MVWEPVLRPFGDQVLFGFGELEMPLRFPGQYFDRETGLRQDWHREYAPGLGRYTQSDPIGIAGGLNVYAYTLGNPVRYSDSDGLNPFDCFSLALDGGHGSLSKCFRDEFIREPIKKRLRIVVEETQCKLSCQSECLITFGVGSVRDAAGEAAATATARRIATGATQRWLLRGIPVVGQVLTVRSAGALIVCTTRCW